MRALESDFDGLLSELLFRKGNLKLRHFTTVNGRLKEAKEELQDLKLCKAIIYDIKTELDSYIKQLAKKLQNDESLFSKNTTIDKFVRNHGKG